MAQRIKGQEVSLSVIIDGRALEAAADFRSFEVAPKLDKKEEGYLGETTNRYDEIFNGVRGRAELHFESQEIFTLMQAVIDRATRRTPGVQVNIKATLQFPNGQRLRVALRDVVFGEMPINFGSRADYGAMTLDFECSNIAVITA